MGYIRVVLMSKIILLFKNMKRRLAKASQNQKYFIKYSIGNFHKTFFHKKSYNEINQYGIGMKKIRGGGMKL